MSLHAGLGKENPGAWLVDGDHVRLGPERGKAAGDLRNTENLVLQAALFGTRPGARHQFGVRPAEHQAARLQQQAGRGLALELAPELVSTP